MQYQDLNNHIIIIACSMLESDNSKLISGVANLARNMNLTKLFTERGVSELKSAMEAIDPPMFEAFAQEASVFAARIMPYVRDFINYQNVDAVIGISSVFGQMYSIPNHVIGSEKSAYGDAFDNFTFPAELSILFNNHPWLMFVTALVVAP